MPPIDYMKVLDIAAVTLESSSHIELRAIDLKIFNAEISREDGTIISIQMRVGDYDIELSFEKNVLDRKEFQLWLNKFEFQLEQNFLKNISLAHSESKSEYKIKIEF